MSSNLNLIHAFSLRRVGGEFSPEILAILTAAVFAVSTQLPNYFCGRSGLMWSTNLMATDLGVLGLYCHLHGSFGIEDFGYMPLICLALFYILFAIGPHRLINEYAEQVIPKKCDFSIRGMLTTTSWLLIYVITRLLPQLIRHIGVGWMFWFMAIMCGVMSIFVKLFVADIDQMPEKFRLVDNSSSSGDSSSSYSENNSVA